jgi:peptidyl-dipeptidase Dcp
MMVFYNKSSSDTNEKMQELESEIGPRLAAHIDSIRLNPAIFARLHELDEQRTTGTISLDPESDWLLSKYLKDFKFAGAALSEGARARVSEINERVSLLEAEFDKRLLADTNDLAIHLNSPDRLTGLTDAEIAACKQAAEDRGRTGYTIPLLNYSGHPLLASLQDRSLREQILKATLSRGQRGNANDTASVVKELLNLRREKAGLFGFQTYVDYVTAQQTSGSGANVHKVLRSIAPAARRNAEKEAAKLQ